MKKCVLFNSLYVCHITASRALHCGIVKMWKRPECNDYAVTHRRTYVKYAKSNNDIFRYE